MFRLQSSHKFYARVDLVRLELEEIEPSAEFNVTGFMGEVDEFGKRTSYLFGVGTRSVPTSYIGGLVGRE
jgi:hypothetical protein